METNLDITSEGPGNQPGGIASGTTLAEQSSEGPVFNGRITGSARLGSKGVKRKLNVQTFEVKYQAILDVEKGMKKKDVAIKYGVPANTVSTWLKKSDSIKEKFLDTELGPQRKRDKKAKFPEVENALMQWFRQARSNNIPLSGEIIKEKAKYFADQLNVTDFESSTGWLDRFKDRHNLTFKKVCGEANSVDKSSKSMSDWQSKLQTILKEYAPDDIYNADETGLFFRMMPDKTLEFKDIKCHGGKMSKDRLTVLVCSNMTGSDKLQPFVIGKSRNPRCFKNLTQLPLEYEANKTAWVTSEIFTNWVKKLDRRVSKKNRKIVLIVDNCPAHPDIPGLKSVQLVFLPPNTTSQTQPMDQGVIRNLKTHYRKMVIQRQLRAIDTATDTPINVLDALYMLKNAWRQVTPKTIENCYRHAGFTANERPASDSDSDDDIPLAVLGRLSGGITLDQYASVDENLPVCADITDNDIVENILSQRQPCMMPDDDEDDTEPKPRVTIQEAMDSLDNVRDFLYQSGVGSCTDNVSAQISDISVIFQKHYLHGIERKQCTMDDFFVSKLKSD